jgi:hypothetical protein
MTWLSTQAQVSQALYPDKIPNYIAGTNVESSSISGGILRISNVSDPVYTLYLSQEKTASAKPMVIIFPGHIRPPAATVQLSRLSSHIPGHR